MKITKYAHSCLLVEKDGVRIITDPGSWNPLPDTENIDAIVITHEHQDHFLLEQVEQILSKSPQARVITHEAVGKLLDAAGIKCSLIKNGESIDVKGLSIESYGTEHAIIYGNVSPCQNTGYLIGGELFAPGDALHDVPSKSVRILALPTGGPWMRLSEAIDYAKKLRPQIVFPIHDAMYIESYRDGLATRIIGGNLESEGSKFTSLAPGETKEF